MPVVFIPPPLRELTGGQELVSIEGTTVRELIDALDRLHPGVKQQLCDGDRLRPGLAVVVGGSASSLGLRQRVPANAEVHFLPAIGGG